MLNMFSPFIELVSPGGKVRNFFSKMDVWLSRKEPADIAEFTLKTGLPALGLAKGAPVEIWIGYDPSKAWRVFAGYVTEPRSPNYLCKDEALKLFKTNIVQSFQDVAPQDVIRFGLLEAGITVFTLDDTVYPHKSGFVAAGENVSDLVKRVNATWGITNDHYFDGDRRFYWTPPTPQPGPVYVYEYGENILSLEFFDERDPYGQRAAGSTSGAGKLLTVASPFISHSREIKIIWPEVRQTRYLVETVRHFLNDKGSLRTEIYFREMAV
ncbi:hypothetical protein [Pelotomaculum propionicicum]|uniref:Uncharacterized protein n=1 Tax=Pelotomaculum propionicicum TaxID=258475 RepID=A0A4Y7RJH8_9FIRM|nr:hypothetical protein [Pelotomaculum propionicicum]TEB09135.1 hypothetical protein Pmgp_03356 [Pelotomaculum propionicicum]